MSKITYFQRYSSVENTVTNNTLQLFARIYAYSPKRAAAFLSELTGVDLDIGVSINQQVRGTDSVPDGSISQPSFKVLVEAKVDSGRNDDQLLRHARGFGDEAQKILLLLSKKHSPTVERRLAERIASEMPGVVFKSVTYEDVCRHAQSLFQAYEYDIKEIVDDYVEYCNDVGLFDQSPYLMRIVPCGQSYELNETYGIYFQPVSRGYTPHRYVGIYRNKRVSALWEVESVFDVSVSEGAIAKRLVKGRETDEYDERLKAIIADAETHCGYHIAQGYRFFCGRPVATNYRKTSPGGI
ncbi:hypothetical protein R5M92_10605 [Halomonas sp. Bachu 37]|uniref:hypothetical protein n=1 Tax=Halomonas kashgarensis TaxID=3084920 RepID=UPI00321714E8